MVGFCADAASPVVPRESGAQGRRVRVSPAAVNAPALLVGVALAVSACGGSSSETPPPLEPLPSRISKTMPQTRSSGAPRSTLTIGIDETDEAGPPAPATWGTGAAQSSATTEPRVPMRLPDAGLK